MENRRRHRHGKQLSDFMIAYQRWVSAGKPQRNDDGVATLFSVCQSCEFFRATGNDQGRCGKCGCALNLGRNLNKLRWATEACPAGKWDREVAVSVLTEREQKAKARAERAERRRARIERRNAREERKRKRIEDRIKLGEPSPIIPLPPNTDPLRVCDRNLLVNHAVRDAWKDCPAFVVCGGPSINLLDLNHLRDSRVMSIGVNNVAAYAPVKAFVYSDPTEKFHSSIFLNPGVMVFAPRPKLQNQLRTKVDGKFKFATRRVCDCPNVWGYERESRFDPSTFLTDEIAQWGSNPDKHESNRGRAKVLFTPFLAMRLLHYLGVRTMFLLGMDFHMTPGPVGGYAFGQGRTSGAAASNNAHYRRVNGMMHELRPHLEKAGVEVFNCNPKSRLSAFPHVDYEEALRICRDSVPPADDLSGWYEKDPSKGE